MTKDRIDKAGIFESSVLNGCDIRVGWYMTLVDWLVDVGNSWVIASDSIHR